MRALFIPAAIAAFALIVPTLALADDADDGGDAGSASLATPSTDTIFDLGIDVSDVANNSTAVRSFIAGLEPDTQDALMGACEHFVQAPATAQNEDTIAFCESAVRG